MYDIMYMVPITWLDKFNYLFFHNKSSMIIYVTWTFIVDYKHINRESFHILYRIQCHCSKITRVKKSLLLRINYNYFYLFTTVLFVFLASDLALGMWTVQFGSVSVKKLRFWGETEPNRKTGQYWLCTFSPEKIVSEGPIPTLFS